MPRSSREWIVLAIILGSLPVASAGSGLIISATESYHGCPLGGYGGYSLVGPCNQDYFVQQTPAFTTGSLLVVAADISLLVAWGIGLIMYVRPGHGTMGARTATLWVGAVTAVGLLALGAWLVDDASGVSTRVAQTCSFSTACQEAQVGGFNQVMGLAGQLILTGAIVLAFTALAVTGQLERLSGSKRSVVG